MPLPDNGTAWPPPQMDRITSRLSAWDAWWTGDPKALRTSYMGQTQVTTRPSQRRGGVTGALARFWWGRPFDDLTQHRDETHVPIAADIARTSADLLFSEPPDIHVADKATQNWLEDGLENEVLATLTGAAERAAALGGVFLRVVWDPAIKDRAFLVATPAHEAIPEFRWDQLVAATFYHNVSPDPSSAEVYRHLERYELNPEGIGLVQHALYRGNATSLGTMVPLEELDITAPLAAMVDTQGYVIQGRTPGLGVVYVPNTTPLAAKAWSMIPEAKGLGGSDYDGVETLFDNLDEIHSSWMRDIRLAKSRLIVARHMLENNGPGNGATFNTDQEIYSPLNLIPPEDGDAPITPVQFEIRFEAHRASAQVWANRIIQSSGYSLQTFGGYDTEYSSNSGTTATEVQSRDNRSRMTRGRKVREWTPALTRILMKLMSVDAEVFSRGHKYEDLAVTFPQGIWDTQASLAQTAQTLRTAEAASTEVLVQLVHPDWDEPKVKAEVALIEGERSAKSPTVPDPFAVGTQQQDGQE